MYCSLNSLVRGSFALLASALCVGCGAIELFRSSAESPVRRIYCSANSIGFDFHFNFETGDIYSYNKRKNALVPFNIKEELPFSDFYPKQEFSQALVALDLIDVDTSINQGELKVSLKPVIGSGQSGFIDIGFGLKSLDISLDTELPDAPFPPALVVPLINDQVSCEYIKPESIEIQ